MKARERKSLSSRVLKVLRFVVESYASNPALAAYSPFGQGSLSNGHLAVALMSRRPVVARHPSHEEGEFCEHALCPQAWT